MGDLANLADLMDLMDLLDHRVPEELVDLEVMPVMAVRAVRNLDRNSPARPDRSGDRAAPGPQRQAREHRGASARMRRRGA